MCPVSGWYHDQWGKSPYYFYLFWLKNSWSVKTLLIISSYAGGIWCMLSQSEAGLGFWEIFWSGDRSGWLGQQKYSINIYPTLYQFLLKKCAPRTKTNLLRNSLGLIQIKLEPAGWIPEFLVVTWGSYSEISPPIKKAWMQNLPVSTKRGCFFRKW